MSSPLLTRTKAQLKDLGYPYVGIELKDGSKVFGTIDHFTPNRIYVKDRHDESGEAIDVPRRIIKRAFLLIKGDNCDESAKVS